MKKRSIFPLLAALTATTAMAHDFPYLVLANDDESKIVLSVESLELSVSDGALIISNGDGKQSFPLSALSRMFFSTDGTSAITQVGTSANDGVVDVFTAGGLPVGRFASIDKAKASLRPGLYVFKTGNSNLKIAVK